MSEHACFFGYGSLVNRDTHSFTGAQPARLDGWRRVWRQTGLRHAAYLTVIRDDTCRIDGLVAPVPQNDWAALDRREGAYMRLNATHQIRHALPQNPQIAVYSIPETRHVAPDEEGPILLSYLDVVVQGYLREFGEAGAARFFDTTSGWDIPVLNDRNAPRYPRHCQLDATETGFVDDQLSTRPIRLVESA